MWFFNNWIILCDFSNNWSWTQAAARAGMGTEQHGCCTNTNTWQEQDNDEMSSHCWGERARKGWPAAGKGTWLQNWPSCISPLALLAHRGTSLFCLGWPGCDWLWCGTQELWGCLGGWTKSCSWLWVLPSKASANADPWQDPSKGSFGNVFALLMTYPWSFCLCFAFKERPIITGSNNYSTGEAGKQNSFSKASLGLPDLLKENPNKCDSLPCPSSWLAVSLMFIPHLGLLLVQWSLQAKELTNLV